MGPRVEYYASDSYLIGPISPRGVRERIDVLGREGEGGEGGGRVCEVGKSI